MVGEFECGGGGNSLVCYLRDISRPRSSGASMRKERGAEANPDLFPLMEGEQSPESVLVHYQPGSAAPSPADRGAVGILSRKVTGEASER